MLKINITTIGFTSVIVLATIVNLLYLSGGGKHNQAGDCQANAAFWYP